MYRLRFTLNSIYLNTFWINYIIGVALDLKYDLNHKIKIFIILHLA
jgi:hypothetical protein